MGTWIEKVNMPLLKAFIFLAERLWIASSRFGIFEDDLQLSSDTIVNWSDFCRQVYNFLKLTKLETTIAKYYCRCVFNGQKKIPQN